MGFMTFESVANLLDISCEYNENSVLILWVFAATVVLYGYLSSDTQEL